MADLEGKVAIVTGGARGIGRSHVLALARAGAAVVVNDLGGNLHGAGTSSSGPADELVAEIIAEGGRAVADGTDVSDWDAVGGIVQTAVDAFGRLDIVVNNAGVVRFGTIDTITRDDWDRTLAVGLTGTAALCHWAAAHWRQQGPEAGRRIINTSSGVGLFPQPNNPMYVAAKAGVAALTISNAIELAELGVRVNGLAPVARTRISEHIFGELMSMVPPGFDRMSPDHAAAMVAYLASPRCRFTGRIFGVVGDDVTIFDSWTAAHHVDNGESAWTTDSLAAALEKAPVQQNGSQQAIKGVDPLVSPSDEILAKLGAIEAATAS